MPTRPTSVMDCSGDAERTFTQQTFRWVIGPRNAVDFVFSIRQRREKAGEVLQRMILSDSGRPDVQRSRRVTLDAAQANPRSAARISRSRCRFPKWAASSESTCGPSFIIRGSNLILS